MSWELRYFSRFTYDHDEKTQATDDQSVRHNLYQRDIREKGLDIFREVDNFLMTYNHRFHDVLDHATLNVAPCDFYKFLPHYVNLSTYMENLKHYYIRLVYILYTFYSRTFSLRFSI